MRSRAFENEQLVWSTFDKRLLSSVPNNLEPSWGFKLSEDPPRREAAFEADFRLEKRVCALVPCLCGYIMADEKL